MTAVAEATDMLDQDDDQSDSQMVAEHYAELLNLIHDHDGEIPQHILDIANMAIEGSDHEIHFDGHRFEVVDAGQGEEDDDHPRQYHAEIRAPSAGISILGKYFRGGTYIPTKLLKKLTPAEKQETWAKIAAAQGVDPQVIAQALAKRQGVQQDVDSKHKNLQRMYEAMRRNHGEALEKNLALEGHELSKHADKGGQHKKRLHNKLAGIGSMLKMAQGKPAGPGGGAKLPGGGAVQGVPSVAGPGGRAVQPGEAGVQMSEHPETSTTPPPEHKDDKMAMMQSQEGISVSVNPRGGYFARIKEFTGQGQTPDEAVGDLFKRHGQSLGMPVRRADNQPMTERGPPGQYQKVSVIEREEHSLLAMALQALASRGDGGPHTHVHLPESLKLDMNVPVPIVNVSPIIPAPVISLPPAMITVEAPVVNVAPANVVVEQKAMRKTVTKTDKDGNPTEITEEPI